MTVVVRNHTSENYSITLAVEQGYYGPYYSVQVCPRISYCECGYPIRDMTYPISEEKRANATFNRYKRKYI